MQGGLDLQCADRLAITGGRDRRGAGGVAVFRRFFQRDGADRRTGCEGNGICNEAAVEISADLDGIAVRLAAIFQRGRYRLLANDGIQMRGDLCLNEILVYHLIEIALRIQQIVHRVKYNLCFRELACALGDTGFDLVIDQQRRFAVKNDLDRAVHTAGDDFGCRCAPLLQ